MTTLTRMKGKEFIKRVLAGKKDFYGIRLEERTDLNSEKDFQRMISYLKSQDLAKEPLDISGSDFSYIKAVGLYLPFTKGVETFLKYADLKHADLKHADLKHADLKHADLRDANLGDADLGDADLGDANLGDANLGYARLIGVKNLEKTIGLEYAHFNNTRVTLEQEKIIKKILKKRILFVIEE